MRLPRAALTGLATAQLLTALGGAAAVAQSAGPRPAAAARAAATASAQRSAPTRAGVGARHRPTARAVPPPAAGRAPAQPAHPPVRTSRPRVRRTSSGARTAQAGSAQQQLRQAVARIPGYRAGAARWVLQAKDGYWGTADWDRGVVYISPKVPASKLYDVVVHEWAHLLTLAVYGGDAELAMAATNRFFGGSGVTGAEKAADCMSLQLGAGWTRYTRCADGRWQGGAAQLLAGEPV